MRRWVFPTMLIKVIPIWVFSILIVGMYYFMHMIFKVSMPEGILNFIMLTAVFVGSVSFLGVFIISGFTWPLNEIPAFVQLIANSIPLTPFLQAFKILLIQKGSVELTFPYLKHLGILLLVYAVLGWIALKIKLWITFRYIKPEESLSEEPVNETDQ